MAAKGGDSMIHTLNRNYVLAPFHVLMSNCQNNVLMGLRIVQTLEKFPDPTPEELHFFQLSFAGPPTDLSRARQHFKNWVLAKGFGDIQKCIRATLERLFIFRTVELKIKANEKFDIGACEKELWRRARQPGYPVLVDKINSLFGEPLRYQDELDSFNNARNCLEHENGVVTEKRCTNPEKNKLVIHGTRFKMFCKTAQAEVPAELGKPGPRTSPLMLGAEEFQIEFGIGQLLEISLKQFIDILNTCVFIRADIESRLSKNVAVATT